MNQLRSSSTEIKIITIKKKAHMQSAGSVPDLCETRKNAALGMSINEL